MTSAQTHSVRSRLPRGGSLPDDVWNARHRSILVFAWLHVPVLLVVGLLEHDSLLMSVAGCLAPALLAAGGSLQRWSRTLRASSVTLSLLTSTALLIHLFHGLIEIHFHFFVVIAVIALYQQWTPYLIGLSYVLVHHALMGVLMPMAVYNHPAAIAHPVLFAAIHGGFVLAESVACLAYWRVNEQAIDREREHRQRAEEVSAALAMANQEMADLMAMVSHDLRAPLMVINGTAELALQAWPELDDTERFAFMSKVGTAGTSLEEMLEETLTLSAIDGDGMQPRPVAVPVEEALRSLSLSYGVLDLDLDDLDGATAMVDRQHLMQVLTNLVTNAMKYGAPPFTVRGQADVEAVELVVSDFGTGVPAEFVPRLFDRYSRSDEARRGPERGTGLGLYIVASLVEANGGSIDYRTSSGNGAEFVVRLRRGPRLLVAAP